MKGDFSRKTFNENKHYSAVLMQQGRVQVDADWNEQQAINQHRLVTTTKDIIGKCGVPNEMEGGFAITWQYLELGDVFFIGSEKGWLVGHRGTIWVTADGGNTWTEQQSKVVQNLHALYFVNEQKGWVVGQKGTILKTTDGGKTWTQQTSNVQNDLNDVYFIDEFKGWAVGDNSTILATINGGKNWDLKTISENISDFNLNLNSLYFVNSENGWAVGDNGTILKATRDGEDIIWSPLPNPPVEDNLNSVYFVDANTGWAVGDNGTILKATREGEDIIWLPQTSPVEGNLNSVYFVDADTGWAVGDEGKILVKTNGHDWALQGVPDNIGNLNSVYFVDAQTGWAVISSKGKFLTYQSDTWSDSKQLYDFDISAGHIYVNGILCENEEPILFAHQLDFPGATLPQELTEGDKYRFYLDVWQRHITSLDDPQIQEVALGGADTATRAKILWQVKAEKKPETIDDQDFTCSSPLSDCELSTGTLKARTTPPETSTELCQLPPSTGYKRLENQLYRVEIHQGGELGTDEVTFKWSRENGSIITAIEEIKDDNRTLIVADLGKDKVLGFASNQWVEVIDDRLELDGKLGYLALIDTIIDTIEPATHKITLKTETTLPPNAIDMMRHPKLRRWDQPYQPGETDVPVKGIIITPSIWMPLEEEDIQVQFSPGIYKTGDYWLIPARTATAEIEWPPYDPEQEPIAQPPLGIEHHCCSLAIATFKNGNSDEPWEIEDCRPIFSSLTELSEPTLSYVGGDGQEVMPDFSKDFALLPQPLQVRVTRGAKPVAEVEVNFTIKQGTGKLSEDEQEWLSEPVTAKTDEDGIATCYWKLDLHTYSQRVEAKLVNENIDENKALLINFSANLSVASQVSYQAKAECETLKEANTVQDAIDKLCEVYQPHKLNQLAFGLAVGMVFALYIFLGCLLVLIQNNIFADFFCCIPREVDISLSVCAMRAFINFLIGFVLGWFIAYYYNLISSANLK